MDHLGILCILVFAGSRIFLAIFQQFGRSKATGLYCPRNVQLITHWSIQVLLNHIKGVGGGTKMIIYDYWLRGGSLMLIWTFRGLRSFPLNKVEKNY